MRAERGQLVGMILPLFVTTSVNEKTYLAYLCDWLSRDRIGPNPPIRANVIGGSDEFCRRYGKGKRRGSLASAGAVTQRNCPNFAATGERSASGAGESQPNWPAGAAKKFRNSIHYCGFSITHR
jgi:hypothetical protein